MRSALSIVAVALILAACAGNIDPGRQLDDAALARNVREALESDSALRSMSINVAARRGEVTLTGVVRTTAQRDRATAVAQSVPDGRGVNPLLTVQ